jgi:3-deoxy-manno-octulosonate cytidylyltransferase (CMP-KDO synthetase)
MFHVVIPARFAASRLPGKPLLNVGDRPLIQWVWQRGRDSGAASVTVATDDERIRAAALQFGAEVVMTSTQHNSGTDRIAEAARARGLAAEDIVVNLQGDEPMMPPEVIAQVAAALAGSAGIDIATAAAPVQSLPEYLDPNCVKAVCARDGRALYFSRAPLPWPRDHAARGQPTQYAGALRHIGIYATACAVCCSSQHGRRHRWRRQRNWSNCALSSTACASTS